MVGGEYVKLSAIFFTISPNPPNTLHYRYPQETSPLAKSSMETHVAMCAVRLFCELEVKQGRFLRTAPA